MARHDHYCHDCKAEFEVHTAEPSACPRCGSLSTHWLPKLLNTSAFAQFYHPNLGHEPVLIDSARTFDREQQKAGVFVKDSPKREKFQHLPQTYNEAKYLA